MKTALVGRVSGTGFAFGEQPKPARCNQLQANEVQAGELRRLDSVTWDLKTNTPTWIVQTWTVQKSTENNDKFVSSGFQSYELRPDGAVMAVATEAWGFYRDDAALLRRLLDMRMYYAQPVVWWDHAEQITGFPTPDVTPSMNMERPAKQRGELRNKPEPKEGTAPSTPNERPAPSCGGRGTFGGARMKAKLWILLLVLAVVLCVKPFEAQIGGLIRRLPFLATMYATSGTTKSGLETQPGTVAADPNVLPLGTKISVTNAGSYSGIYTVTDTGSKVRGNHIDIFMPSWNRAKEFGRQVVRVTVLKWGEWENGVTGKKKKQAELKEKN